VVHAVFFRHHKHSDAFHGIEPLGQVLDVFTVISLIGEITNALALQLSETQFQRFGQDVHLIAGVVDIKLPGGVVAHKLHDPVESVSKGGGPGANDVERAGGIGTHKFQQDLFALAEISGRVVLSLAVDSPQHHLIEGR